MARVEAIKTPTQKNRPLLQKPGTSRSTVLAGLQSCVSGCGGPRGIAHRGDGPGGPWLSTKDGQRQSPPRPSRGSARKNRRRRKGQLHSTEDRAVIRAMLLLLLTTEDSEGNGQEMGGEKKAQVSLAKPGGREKTQLRLLSHSLTCDCL